jgi:hypothetical protein
MQTWPTASLVSDWARRSPAITAFLETVQHFCTVLVQVSRCCALPGWCKVVQGSRRGACCNQDCLSKETAAGTVQDLPIFLAVMEMRRSEDAETAINARKLPRHWLYSALPFLLRMETDEAHGGFSVALRRTWKAWSQAQVAWVAKRIQQTSVSVYHTVPELYEVVDQCEFPLHASVTWSWCNVASGGSVTPLISSAVMSKLQLSQCSKTQQCRSAEWEL